MQTEPAARCPVDHTAASAPTSIDVERMAADRAVQARLPDGLKGLSRQGLHTLLFRQPKPSRGAKVAPSPPEMVPLLGHVRSLGGGETRLRNLLQLRAEYGDVVRFRFGPVTAHLVSDPELVKTAVQERHRIYGKQTRGAHKLRLVLGMGLLTSDGPHWLKQRRIAQPAFHRRRIEGFGPRMVQAADELTDAWTDGGTLDAHSEMMRVTLRVVSETLLGAGIDRDTADAVADALEVVQRDANRRVNAVVDLPPQVPTRYNRRFNAAMDTLDAIVLEMIARRRRAPDAETDDLLTALLHARDPETGEQMSDAQLRDEVMTIFLAGHETTANALSWTLYLLSRSPEVRRRLEAEVDEVLEGRAPTVEDCKRLTYTMQVVLESMRLFPPAWMTARAPNEDDVLGGYFMPKHSLVLLSPWIVHRHPDHWEDPEGFDPERFTKDRIKQRHRFAYFPFGGGPRLCIGQHFALLEAQLLLATWVRKWRLDLVPGHPVEIEPLVTLRPRYGLKVTTHRR